jgi:hypothetical protein
LATAAIVTKVAAKTAAAETAACEIFLRGDAQNIIIQSKILNIKHG